MKNIQMVDLQSQYKSIQKEVEEVIQEVLSSAHFIKGPAVAEFEKKLSNHLNVANSVGCGNGTDALQIALMALELPAGSEIIVPDFTFIATAEVVSLLGFIPVFADVDRNTFNIDTNSILENITEKTAAIIPVHLFGQSCDMDSILRIARENNLAVVEDNAQAIGALYLGKETKGHLGTLGNIGCTSFFPSKNLGAYGDGGALFTNDNALARKIRIIANHGMETRYYHDVIGVNSRLDSIQAAILNVKLDHLEQYNQNRRDAAQKYNEAFQDVEEIITPYEASYSTHVFHQYTLRIRDGQRDGLTKTLVAKNIPHGVYYPVPLHQQKAFVNSNARWADCSQSVELSREVISLPMHTELTDDMIDYISETVVQHFK